MKKHEEPKLRPLRVLAFGAIGLLVAAAPVWYYLSDDGDEPEAPSPPPTLDEAVHLSARYLAGWTGDTGIYQYRLNMDPDVNVESKYNILRHAGAIYALCMYLERHPDPAVRTAMLRAAGYLRDEALAPIPGEMGLAGIWSLPGVNNTANPPQVKLGGAGLGLVALARVEDLQPGFTPRVGLRCLGRFIRFMQKDDGSFYSKYIPSGEGRDDSWVSLYYPGEAALGMVMLYELDPEPDWLKTAAKALGFLARSRKDMETVPADHWALLATGRIMRHLGKPALGVTKDELLRHAVQICTAILSGQVDDATRPDYDGGFTEDGRTTPTATRLEGLLAAREFLPADHPLQGRIEKAAERGIAFLVRAVVPAGAYVGGMPRAVDHLPGKGEEVRSFNNRAAEIRIDYVQHAMCAMMQYLDGTAGE